MKTLDMADKYPPAEDFEEEEITVKVHMPNFFPKVIVSREYECDCGDEDCDVCKTDLYGKRDTVPMPSSYPHSHVDHPREPLTRKESVGLVLIFGSVILFWAGVLYLIFR